MLDMIAGSFHGQDAVFYALKWAAGQRTADHRDLKLPHHLLHGRSDNQVR